MYRRSGERSSCNPRVTEERTVDASCASAVRDRACRWRRLYGIPSSTNLNLILIWLAQWADDLRATVDIGAQVAIRIQNRITRFLIKSKLGSCKAVVRIYQNCTARQLPRPSLINHLGRKTHAQSVLAFNQTVPLFDHVDVGHGKERADVKIRGMSKSLCSALTID